MKSRYILIEYSFNKLYLVQGYTSIYTLIKRFGDFFDMMMLVFKYEVPGRHVEMDRRP